MTQSEKSGAETEMKMISDEPEIRLKTNIRISLFTAPISIPLRPNST